MRSDSSLVPEPSRMAVAVLHLRANFGILVEMDTRMMVLGSKARFIFSKDIGNRYFSLLLGEQNRSL